MSSEQRVRFIGARTTDSGLIVQFTIGDRAAKRVRELSVPFGDLLDAHVVPGINREASRRLKALWDQRDEALPWE